MSKIQTFLDELMSAPETDACILWPFSVGKARGYGGHKAVVGGRRYFGAHRVVCALAHGPAPRKYEAAHSCNVRNCVNPKHLSWKAPAENQADQWGHGTKRFGANHHNSKLTDEAVLEFRAIAREFAERYGCSMSTLGRVLQSDTWKHLEEP